MEENRYTEEDILNIINEIKMKFYYQDYDDFTSHNYAIVLYKRLFLKFEHMLIDYFIRIGYFEEIDDSHYGFSSPYEAYLSFPRKITYKAYLSDKRNTELYFNYLDIKNNFDSVMSPKPSHIIKKNIKIDNIFDDIFIICHDKCYDAFGAKYTEFKNILNLEDCSDKKNHLILGKKAVVGDITGIDTKINLDNKNFDIIKALHVVHTV